MRCRIQHIGRRGSPNLSISDFTLAPGFTSPDFDLDETSPEHQIVQDWVQEGLVKILPPSSTEKPIHGGAGGRSKKPMSAEEVKDLMSPVNKRRQRMALSRTERNFATHKAPIGMPFGPGRNARILSAEDLANGKPEPLAPPPPPRSDRDEIEIGETGEPKRFSQEDLRKRGQYLESQDDGAAVAGGADKSQAMSKPMEEPKKEHMVKDPKKMNKAKAVQEALDTEAPEDDEEEEGEPEDMGEQPVDNVILDHFVEELESINKSAIIAIAEKEGIEVPDKINKASLVALVAEALVRKGYLELPE